MNAGVKLSVFTLGLVAAFAVAFGVGRLTGPTTAPTGMEMADSHDGSHQPAGATQAVPGGLQIAQEGYRLHVLTPQLSTSDAFGFRFQIVGPDGKPVTAYTRAHEKELHLIVVRRDLTGFKHLHPALSSDGVWSVPLTVASAGSYRVFADFQPAGRATGLVLGADVAAAGDFQPRPPAFASTVASVGDYQVSLGGALFAGATSKLTLTVNRAGGPVTDLQPYLGAFGHLVVLRDGDLAYLHVHPEASTAAGPQIVFSVEVPSAGRYGLFLDFQHQDSVHTAAFIATAEPGH